MTAAFTSRLLDRLRPASPRLFAIKALIWLAAAVIVVVGVQVAGIGFGSGPGAAPTVTAASAAVPAVVTNQPSAAQAPPLGNSGGGWDFAPITNATCATGATYCEYGQPIKYNKVTGQFDVSPENEDNLSKAVNLLPAWRWGGSVQMYSNEGISDWLFNSVANAILPAVATICFTTASWIWQLLLAIIAWGLSADVIGTLGDAINGAFAGLANNLNGAGLWGIIGFGVLFIVLRMLLKGQVTRILSVVLMFLIPTATMWALAAMVNNSPSSGPGSGTQAAGTPAWVASVGTNLLQETSQSLTQPIGTLAGGSGSAAAIAQEENKVTPNCAQYDAALYAYYDSLAGQSGSASGMSALDDVSYLWQSAFETDWEIAQFGTTTGGARLVCHQLERNANVPATEQQAIALTAYKGLIPTTYDAADPSKDVPNIGVFLPNSDRKTEEGNMFYWDACLAASPSQLHAEPGWSVEPKNSPFSYVGSSSKLVDGKLAGPAGGGGIADDSGKNDCQHWWTTGDMRGKLKFDTENSLQTATLTPPYYTGDSNACTNCNWSTQEQQVLKAVYSTVNAYWGHNLAQRMLEGLLAMVTAFVYLWSLGGLAVGCVAAEVGCVLMFILLPVTLTALSAGALTGGNSKMGRKMLKLTGGFMASKLVFNLVLFALLQIIYISQRLLNHNGDGLNGIMQAILPVLAILLLRKLLSYIGLGDITKVSGAVGLASAAAVKATGDKKMLEATHAGFRKATGRVGDLSAGSAARAGARATARMGKFAGRKLDQHTDLSNRLNLAERKTNLLGRKDKDGNVVERGLAQQVAWFGALVDAAGKNKRLAPLLASSVENQAGMRALQARQTAAARKTVATERALRREQIAATRGMTREQRIADTEKRLAASEERRRVDGAKRNVLGWEKDAAGNLVPVMAGKLTAGETYSDDEVRAIMKQAADGFGVEEDQVVGSHLGFATELMPHSARANGTGRTVAQERKMAPGQGLDMSKDGVLYLDWETTRRKDGESMTAWNYRLGEYRQKLGAVDASGNLVDWVEHMTGTSLDSAEGRSWYEADQRGEITPIATSVKASLPSSVIADIDRRAAMLDAEGGMSGRGFDATRVQVVEDKVRQAHDAGAAIDDRRKEVESVANQMARILSDHKSNQLKLPDLMAKRDAAKDPTTQAALSSQVDQISRELETAAARLGELRPQLFQAAHASIGDARAAQSEAVTLKFFAEIQRGERTFDAIQFDAVEAEKAITKATKQAQDTLARLEDAVIKANDPDTARKATQELQSWATRMAAEAANEVDSAMGRVRKELKEFQNVQDAISARYSFVGPQLPEDVWGREVLKRFPD